ncbi:MAG: hypothetical protein PHO66_01815 [Eubacteriales bacterium]|nr:hypothetical protein [Eubacteriales bacterium]
MRYLRVIGSDLKRGFGSPLVWLAVAAAGALMLQFQRNEIVEMLGHYTFSTAPEYLSASVLRESLNWFSGARHVLPFLVMLPLGIAFCDDITTGNARNAVLRAGRAPYIWGRGISTVLAGGLIIAALLLVCEVAIHAIFPPRSPLDVESINVLFRGDDMQVYRIWQWLPPGRWADVLYCLFSDAAWVLVAMDFAAVGLLSSALIPNRYVALCAPFMVGYAYDYVLLLLSGFSNHTVSAMMHVNGAGFGRLPPLVFLLVLCIPMVLCLAAYGWVGMRRLQNGY